MYGSMYVYALCMHVLCVCMAYLPTIFIYGSIYVAVKPAPEECFALTLHFYSVKMLLKNDERFSNIYYRASGWATAIPSEMLTRPPYCYH